MEVRKDCAVLLVDGSFWFCIDGEQKIRLFMETMLDLVEILGFSCVKKQDVKELKSGEIFMIDGNPYPFLRKTHRPVHFELGNTWHMIMKAQDVWEEAECPSDLLRCMTTDSSEWQVMHIDSNPLNFNSCNLIKGPTIVNKSMKQGQCQKHGTGYRCTYQFTLPSSEYVSHHMNTMTYQTEDEALFYRDCLKLKLIPSWMRNFIFKFGLIPVHKRSPSFAQLYTCVGDMLQLEDDERSCRGKRSHSKFAEQDEAVEDKAEGGSDSEDFLVVEVGDDKSDSKHSSSSSNNSCDDEGKGSSRDASAAAEAKCVGLSDFSIDAFGFADEFDIDCSC